MKILHKSGSTLLELNQDNLRNANLRYINLRNANLRYINLRSADLQGTDLNWSSHNLIAHILFRNANQDHSKRMIAGLILISKDWCWNNFIQLKDQIPSQVWHWTINTLKPYIKPNDKHHTILNQDDL